MVNFVAGHGIINMLASFGTSSSFDWAWNTIILLCFFKKIVFEQPEQRNISVHFSYCQWAIPVFTVFYSTRMLCCNPICLKLFLSVSDIHTNMWNRSVLLHLDKCAALCGPQQQKICVLLTFSVKIFTVHFSADSVDGSLMLCDCCRCVKEKTNGNTFSVWKQQLATFTDSFFVYFFFVRREAVVKVSQHVRVSPVNRVCGWGERSGLSSVGWVCCKPVTRCGKEVSFQGKLKGIEHTYWRETGQCGVKKWGFCNIINDVRRVHLFWAEPPQRVLICSGRRNVPKRKWLNESNWYQMS